MTEDQETLFDPLAAIAARDEAIQRVDDHAAPEWKALAHKTLREVAAATAEFTTDDLIRAGLNKPREPRALGAIMRWGVSHGLIEATGRVRRSEQVTNHSRPMAVWRSRVYKDTPW